MSNEIAIAVQGVSKRYFVYENQRARLRHAFWPKSAAGVSEIWALRDVSFQVKKGESLAIIGRNGGGKSTLLEIITGTLTPTEGQVAVNGRVAALLELGSGFNPEYSGRENVFLNGLLMGLTRAEVAASFDDIAAFADIGDVLDRPVKTYSSGMLVRLAFAVQVALEPDILIVDEALSVGDYFFQQKCFGRLRKMREDGLTLLFVSHDMGSVRDLCSQAVYLRGGTAVFVGDSKTAIQQYFAEDSIPADLNTQAQAVDEPNSLALAVPSFDDLPVDVLWRAAGTKTVGILAVRALDMQGRQTTSVRMGDSLQIEAYFRNPDNEHATVTLALKNRYDQIVFATNASRLNIAECHTDEAWGILVYQLEMNLEAGLYSLLLALNSPSGANTGHQHDATEWLGPLHVQWDYERDTAPFLGQFGIPASARLHHVSMAKQQEISA